MQAVFKRELKAYFNSPIGYIFLSIFLLLTGIFFTTGNLISANSRYLGFLGSILFILVFVVPLLTMRLLSDEKQKKTDQLLITSPLRISDIVLGKFLAAFVFFCLGLAVTIVYALIIAIHGELDLWETVGAYIGFILLGGTFISVGLYISGLTENQVTAAITSFAALLAMWLVNILQKAVPSDAASGIIFSGLIVASTAVWLFVSTRNRIIPLAAAILGGGIVFLLNLLNRETFVGLIGRILSWFSLIDRYRRFSTGILSFQDTVYYLTFTAFFLYLTVRTIEKRRWS
ncbi:ABC-2 transporter permease [Marispirochaeta sp.]|jgi:ABC-2 type transport system permease protein|uniref:ABC transporter permease n=1 Tax=Marispirochaeta sp. TaxID=2038653 RepID=UPI0029C62EDD|nr:ABC-2 transporter permease [Marispirochaeta sp.]